MVTTNDRLSSRIRTETQLLKSYTGFTASFLGIQYIDNFIKTSPELITERTCQALFNQLESAHHEKKKQALFLYRSAASCLINILIKSSPARSSSLITRLQSILVSSTGPKLRAVSESLGRLPLTIAPLNLDDNLKKTVLTIDFHHLLKKLNSAPCPDFEWKGRTLIFSNQFNEKCCIKFLTIPGTQYELSNEIYWLTQFKSAIESRAWDGTIPEPVYLSGHHLFSIRNIPEYIASHVNPETNFIAIGYKAPRNYFRYLNLPETENTEIISAFSKNAWQLGHLSSKGIIHTALIPLFHNRQQQTRRADGGVYIWEHSGRLDRWLESTQFPNMAVSGIRDFEHFCQISNAEELYHQIGNQILSLILVAGSLFRNKEPGKKGYDQNDKPLNFCHLFDIQIFSRLITEIVTQFYYGFTGQPLKDSKLFLLVSTRLIEALVENFGKDTHMEERFRVQDQNQMSDREFMSFLTDHGVKPDQIKLLIKGKEDIILYTGPHLGGFNQTISVPELIELLFCLSTLCISDAYLTRIFHGDLNVNDLN